MQIRQSSSSPTSLLLKHVFDQHFAFVKQHDLAHKDVKLKRLRFVFLDLFASHQERGEKMTNVKRSRPYKAAMEST